MQAHACELQGRCNRLFQVLTLSQIYISKSRKQSKYRGCNRKIRRQIQKRSVANLQHCAQTIRASGQLPGKLLPNQADSCDTRQLLECHPIQARCLRSKCQRAICCRSSPGFRYSGTRIGGPNGTSHDWIFPQEKATFNIRSLGTVVLDSTRSVAFASALLIVADELRHP
jgi:hypothetical protein